MEKLIVVKIGGQIIDDEMALSQFIQEFAQLPSPKILIHGGGKLATKLAQRLNVPQTLIEGRRVTDFKTLEIITMVYGGLVNKKIVAGLEALGCSALGVTGADADLIRAKRRPITTIDYGYVGDVEKVNLARIEQWLQSGLVPVIAPITHDGKGQILNTNADTIASAVAAEAAKKYAVSLFYTFEKNGVLTNISDENSQIPEISMTTFAKLREQGKITDGMIPKIENALASVKAGVKEVVIGRQFQTGTRIVSG